MKQGRTTVDFMVTGFIRLNGSTVGCVANRSEAYENGEKVQTLDKQPVKRL